MNFQQKLDNYANILVSHGANIQPGQCVLISGEAIHRELLIKLAENAYKRGAKYVAVEYPEPKVERLRIQLAKEEDLSFVPCYLTAKYKDLVDEHWARIVVLGPEDPDILSDLEPKRVNIPERSRWKALKYYFDEGVGKSKVHWTLAAASSPGWAKKVFPNETNVEKAQELLWDQIFSICRADTDDYDQRWTDHFAALKTRQARLNELGVKNLHFTGPGTDLTVGLSDKAKFHGGPDIGPYGVPFEPNIPTEECFTTPDFRKTAGKVRTTRPFMINGKMIRGLEVEFKEGVISNYTAEEGLETFKEYINSDEGASRLGEVALVGIDSPIYQSGLIFEEILFDENAACHIAVGSAYAFCIDGGGNMSKDDLAQIGCNDSLVHTDMMISSEDVDVAAETHSGEKITLIKGGAWVDF